MQELDVFKVFEFIKKSKHYENLPEDAYLSFIYFADNDFQVGFYLPTENLHRVFYIKPNHKDSEIIVNDEENKKEPPLKLDLDRIVITLHDAKTIADEIFASNYPHDKYYKQIFILQASDLGIVWNVIILTNKFEMINLKICAETGRLLKAKSEKVFDYQF